MYVFLVLSRTIFLFILFFIKGCYGESCMKLLKTKEQKMKLDAERELLKQKRILEEIEQKQRMRQQKIDKINNDYERKLNDYNLRCKMLGSDLSGAKRFFLMFNAIDFKTVPMDRWDGIIAEYGLSDVFKKIDELARPPEKKPDKPVINEDELLEGE